MDKLRFQAKAVRYAPIGKLLHQMKYNSDWPGTLVVEAARSFPSSKTCSSCGFINRELKREPLWTCQECHVDHGRSENAALNLLGLAQEAVMVRSHELACKRWTRITPATPVPNCSRNAAPSKHWA